MQRRRSPPHTFDQNIAAEKARLELQLGHLPQGPERDVLQKKIDQLDTAARMSEWLSPAKPSLPE